MTTKYDELKEAIAEYGEAAMENLVRCKGFGEAVLSGYADWLSCPKEKVVAVPAQGPFDPRHHYGDAAFSFHGAQVVRLEPVLFGICAIVDNVEDSGALWLRTGVRVEVTGDTFDVYVANQPMVKVPLEFSGKLDPVFESIFAELLSVFKKDLATFQDERFTHGIGFMPGA